MRADVPFGVAVAGWRGALERDAAHCMVSPFSGARPRSGCAYTGPLQMVPWRVARPRSAPWPWPCCRTTNAAPRRAMPHRRPRVQK